MFIRPSPAGYPLKGIPARDDRERSWTERDDRNAWDRGKAHLNGLRDGEAKRGDEEDGEEDEGDGPHTH